MQSPLRQNVFFLAILINAFIIFSLYFLISHTLEAQTTQRIKAQIENELLAVKGNVTDVYQANPSNKAQYEADIIQYLSSLAYEDRYFWANDQNAIARVHINPNIVGTFQTSYARQIDNISDGQIHYEIKTNTNPTTQKKELKINGMLLLEPMQWIVGTGIYVNKNDYYYRAIIICFIVQLCIMGLGGLLYVVSKKSSSLSRLMGLEKK